MWGKLKRKKRRATVVLLNLKELSESSLYGYGIYVEAIKDNPADISVGVYDKHIQEDASSENTTTIATENATLNI
jgi:hypothetical protein